MNQDQFSALLAVLVPTVISLIAQNRNTAIMTIISRFSRELLQKSAEVLFI